MRGCASAPENLAGRHRVTARGSPFLMNGTHGLCSCVLLQNLFTSQLEAAKFEGAKVRTVAGVRGEIKRALSDRASRTLGAPVGTVRATFEDKLLPSDLVFVRTWVPVAPVQYYNPVTSLLLGTGRDAKDRAGGGADATAATAAAAAAPPRERRRAFDDEGDERDDERDDEEDPRNFRAEGIEGDASELHSAGGGGLNGSDTWRGMRTAAQMRRAARVPIPVEKDSLYTPVTRPLKVRHR